MVAGISMPTIDRMYAFVAEDNGPADEGLMAFIAPGTGQWMPMVGADLDRIQSLIPMAELIAKQTGKPFKVLLFENRKDITQEIIKLQEILKCPSQQSS